MPQPSITITYTISSVTSNYDGTTTVSYSMTHAGTSTTQTRTDIFLTPSLTNGVNPDTMDAQQREDAVLANFETLNRPIFAMFAAKVRRVQAAQEAGLISGNTNLPVAGLSLIENKSRDFTVY